jgi:bifunctional DNA-binding transcriptional regulator/antitoxin component of YhaV-PrlF toxin-antitoxin module
MVIVGSPHRLSTGHAEQMIGALIPPATRRPAKTGPLLAPEPRRLELPAGADADSLDLDIAQLDGSGRLSARGLLRDLGWNPGHRLDLTVVGDIVIAGSSPTGRHCIGARGDLAIPGSARMLLGLEPGHRVVVVSAPRQGVLLVHPHALIAALLASYYDEQPRGREGDGR